MWYNECMNKNETNLIKFICYAVTMLMVLAALILIAKPAKPNVPVMTEQESARIELQQAINGAGLNALIEIE